MASRLTTPLPAQRVGHVDEVWSARCAPIHLSGRLPRGDRSSPGGCSPGGADRPLSRATAGVTTRESPDRLDSSHQYLVVSGG